MSQTSKEVQNSINANAATQAATSQTAAAAQTAAADVIVQSPIAQMATVQMKNAKTAHNNSLASKIVDEELEIRNEQITEPKIADLIQLLQSNHRSLKTLILKNCLFTTEVNKFGAITHKPISIIPIIPILDALNHNNIVSTLSLDHNEEEDEQISDNNAKAIGELLRVNKTLTTLSLEHCNITAKRMRSIAEGLKDNTSLRTLNLSQNPIQSQGAEDLVLALENNKVLTSLNLAGTELNHLGGCRIAKLIEINLCLKSLILTHNRFDLATGPIIADGLSRMAEKISAINSKVDDISNSHTMEIQQSSKNTKHIGLHTLIIGGYGLGGAALIPAIINYRNIKVLDLSHILIKDYGAKEIANKLLAAKLLKSLKLQNCGIGLEGMKAISAVLSKDVKDQKEKAECSTTIGQTVSAASQPLIEPVGSMELTELETLDLSDNDQHDLQSKLFTEEMALILRRNRTLKTVHFNNNSAYDGLDALADALKINTSLETLSLNSNGIKRLGTLTKALTPRTLSPHAFAINRTLTSLSLMGNPLSFSATENGNALCGMLRANTTLKVLDLRSIKFQGNDGEIWALKLSLGLQDNQALERLDISYCNVIKSGGAEVIFNAIAANKYRALTDLDIADIYGDLSDQIPRANALCQRNRTYRLTWSYISPMVAFGRANHGNAVGTNGAALIPFLPQFRRLMGFKVRDENPVFNQKLGRFITTAYYQSMIKGSQSTASQAQNGKDKVPTAAASLPTSCKSWRKLFCD